jgi:hypothetical protein
MVHRREPNEQISHSKPGEIMPVQSPMRGHIPSPQSVLDAAPRYTPHPDAPSTPPNFITLPQKISWWGNDTYNCCETTEEAFAKTCNSPEIFISDDDVIAWATSYNVLGGSTAPVVMTDMQTGGFVESPVNYADGPYSYVDYTNATTLQSAISNGPVKLGVAADQLQQVVNGGQSGWFATGFQSEKNYDHCVSLCGYGTISWLAQQLKVQVPQGIDGTKPGYAMFTWNSIGIIDWPSVQATASEAWLRYPTTVARPSNPYAVGFYSNVDGVPTWTPQQIAGSGTSAVAPAMARFKNSSGQGTAVVATRPDGSLDFYYNVDGVPSWTPSQIAGSGTSVAAPAMVRFANSSDQEGTLVAVPRPDGSLYFYYNVDGVPTWNRAPISGWGTTSLAPAMVRSVNKSGQEVGTSVVVTQEDGSLHCYSNVDATPIWTSQQIAGSGTSVAAPAMVRFANKSGQQGTAVVARRADGSLYFYYNVDGVPSWTPSQIARTSAAAPAMVRFTNSSGQEGTLVAAPQSDGSLYFYYNVDGVPSWTSQQIAGPGTTLPYLTPAMVRSPNGTEVVAVSQ